MSYLIKSETLWNELQALAEDEGLKLYDIERYGAGAIRVFVTTTSPDAKTSSQDCSKLCRRLMNYFMVEGPRLGVGSEPEIEVSSPGVNRHLRLVEHFHSAIGERVKLGVRGEVKSEVAEAEPIKVGGLIGTLEQASEEFVSIQDERTKKVWQIPYEQISKANVEFKFS